MKKKIKVLIFTCLIINFLKAQNTLNEDYFGSFKKAKFKEDELLDFLPIQQKDMAFSEITWEIIDFKEKLNKIYFYEGNKAGRICKSLYSVLLEGIKNDQIKAYEEDNLESKINKFSLNQRLSKKVITQEGKELFNQGEVLTSNYYDFYEIRPSSIKKFKIKGIWYFDKNQGELNYRIIAFSPIGPDIYQISEGIMENNEVELFWVEYFESRKLLDQAKTCLSYNGLEPSFEELLSTRRFSSFIYKDLYKENLVLENPNLPKKEEYENIKRKIIQKAYQRSNP